MLSSKSTLRVVIPARFGSHRLPGKPLIDLAGKPMVVRVFDAVSGALSGHDIVVAVDDIRIMDVLEEHGVPGAMSDPLCVSGTDRVAEVARSRSWGPDDIILNVQGDEPLIPPELLNAFAAFCLGKSDFSMATVSVPMDELRAIGDPNVVKVTVRQDETAINFTRAPIPFDRDHASEEWELSHYLRHLGIYAYRNAVLQRVTGTPPCTLEQIESLEQLRALWLGIPIHVLAWDKAPPGGVDTADDVARVVDYLNGRQP
jgi:3-deoxy-manno-octulosonate cytidylyltransferase (CMP-KDO synthetase)